MERQFGRRDFVEWSCDNNYCRDDIRGSHSDYICTVLAVMRLHKDSFMLFIIIVLVAVIVAAAAVVVVFSRLKISLRAYVACRVSCRLKYFSSYCCCSFFFLWSLAIYTFFFSILSFIYSILLFIYLFILQGVILISNFPFNISTWYYLLRIRVETFATKMWSIKAPNFRPLVFTYEMKP